MQDRAHDIYRQIDAAIRAESEERPELAGMGTTLTVARNVGRDLVVAHVGDSRAYRLRGKTFCQLTRDHTLAQEMADARGIAPGDVVRHLFRHVLTRAVGGKVVWSGADVNKFDLADGDQVLLCSDGLTDLVPGPMISSVLQTAASAESACDELVSLALSAGGSDNVTCVLARFNLHADEPS
jgi:serine/threonine protein phosphatase PrpC